MSFNITHIRVCVQLWRTAANSPVNDAPPDLCRRRESFPGPIGRHLIVGEIDEEFYGVVRCDGCVEMGGWAAKELDKVGLGVVRRGKQERRWFGPGMSAIPSNGQEDVQEMT